MFSPKDQQGANKDTATKIAEYEAKSWSSDGILTRTIIRP
jgi:hypothetical protein